MYKILNSQGLGVAGRQNELIELALTHKFDGVEVDITDLVGRHDTLGKEFACQFLQSAKIDMGTFCLPANLGGTEEEFTSSIANLETIIDLANTLNAKRCYIKIKPTSDTDAFQENFEKHQTRLREIGEALESHGIQVGVALQASTVKSSEGEFKFVQTADEILTLAKTGQENVGLCLDTWEWVVGGGTLDQLKGLDIAKTITEIRLSDVTEDADMGNVTKNDRTQLPGDAVDSFSVALVKHLIEINYEGPVSVATSVSTFTDGSRESVVGGLSSQLDQLIAGDDPGALAAAAAAEAEAAAAESGEGAEGDEKKSETDATEETVAAGTAEA